MDVTRRLWTNSPLKTRNAEPEWPPVRLASSSISGEHIPPETCEPSVARVTEVGEPEHVFDAAQQRVMVVRHVRHSPRPDESRQEYRAGAATTRPVHARVHRVGS